MRARLFLFVLLICLGQFSRQAFAGDDTLRIQQLLRSISFKSRPVIFMRGQPIYYTSYPKNAPEGVDLGPVFGLIEESQLLNPRQRSRLLRTLRTYSEFGGDLDYRGFIAYKVLASSSEGRTGDRGPGYSIMMTPSSVSYVTLHQRPVSADSQVPEAFTGYYAEVEFLRQVLAELVNVASTSNKISVSAYKDLVFKVLDFRTKMLEAMIADKKKADGALQEAFRVQSLKRYFAQLASSEFEMQLQGYTRAKLQAEVDRLPVNPFIEVFGFLSEARDRHTRMARAFEEKVLSPEKIGQAKIATALRRYFQVFQINHAFTVPKGLPLVEFNNQSLRGTGFDYEDPHTRYQLLQGMAKRFKIPSQSYYFNGDSSPEAYFEKQFPKSSVHESRRAALICNRLFEK